MGGWENDSHGLVFKSSEVKLYGATHTWAMKLSQLNRQHGSVRIITYSLPAIAYIEAQFLRRPYDIWIVCHSAFHDRAQAFKIDFPGFHVATRNDVHSKVVLIEEQTLYISSANFGNSQWHKRPWGYARNRPTIGTSSIHLCHCGKGLFIYPRRTPSDPECWSCSAADASETR